MRGPRFLRPHARWHEQLDAYIDGELPASAVPAFEAHSAGCAGCRARLETTMSLKAELANIPQVPAPRSFRLTTAMVGAPARPVAAGTSWGAFRVAQFATGFAVMALVAVVVIDLSSSSNDDSGGAASAARDEAPASAALQSADAAAPAGGTPAAASSPGIVPPSTGGVSASGYASVTPAATVPAERAASSPVPQDNGFSENPSADGAKALGDAVATGPASQRSSDKARDLRPIEATLVAVVLLGAAVTLGLYLRRRRA
jgi:hypothetical protein